jgi:RNA polymerase sigma-70 factor (ECF subfamily)
MAITVDDLEAARQGDHTAEQVLMDGLYRPVYHFLRRRTGSPEIADELCQTVFLKVYENLGRYDDTLAKVETWVFTIARRTLIDHYRKVKPAALPEDYDPVATDWTSATDRVAKDRLDEAYIARLLTTLPEDSADIVTLRAIDEMSYDDIAVIVGKSSEAVRQIYSRALKELRRVVQEEGNLHKYESG